MVPAAGLESARVRLQNGCSGTELRGLEIHKRPGLSRPKRKSSLPETTVCRSTKGDQYRISGPSYVLAGTAILKKINSRHHATLRPPRVIRWRRSVDVIEIDLAGLSLGDTAASHDGPHEGKHHRRGKDPLALSPSLGAGAGHFSLSALGQRGESRCRLTLLLSWWSRDFRAALDSSDLASSRTCATNHTAE